MRRRLFFCVLVGLGGIGCTPPPAVDEGVLRVAIRREPSTWNRLLAADLETHIIADQLHAPLIRLNQETQRMEPALAESWEFSEDGSELFFHLRQGVRFSDGQPFTAADVAFTFRVLNDPTVASPLVDTARIDGKPIAVDVIDDATVCFRLPRRTATVERIFDSIRILPEHLLAESLSAGTLAADTGLGAPPEAVVGLGPFRLREYVPGLRIVLERNPNYWKTESGGTEGTFPRLAELVFDVVPDENAQLLRLRAGEIDLLALMSPESFLALGRDPPEGIALRDLGPGMVSERFWFNLNPESPIEAYKKRWFENVRFRRAVSLAIDRDDMARVVFAGLATPARGPVSPANHFWRNREIGATVRDLERARALLAEAGFRWNGDRLHDDRGNPVRFTILTSAGNEQRVRTAVFVQEDLMQIGIETTLAPVDGNGLVASITRHFDYEACLLGITQTDPDPSAEMGLWLSRAPLHLWHPAQETPETPWEARIDELMETQMASLDVEERKVCYDEIQAIVADQMPILDLVVPHAFVAFNRSLASVRATPFGHVLWNSDEIFYLRGEKPTWSNTRDSGH